MYRLFLFLAVSLCCQSCFLITLPVAKRPALQADTLHVVHFVVSPNKSRIADSTLLANYAKESTEAYKWLSAEAAYKSVPLHFVETWAQNTDSVLGKNFVFKLPNNSLQVLTRHRYFKVKVKKRTRYQEEEFALLNWQRQLYDSVAAHLTDTSLKTLLHANKPPSNYLLVFHLTKVKRSCVLGLYQNGHIFVGKTYSSVIAHESLHHFGAPDLYVHNFWFGRRRRVLHRELPMEIMDLNRGKIYDCKKYHLTNYTAYSIGWDATLEKSIKPLQRINLMALCVYYFGFPFF